MDHVQRILLEGDYGLGLQKFGDADYDRIKSFLVTESARAHSYYLSTQIQKTC